MAASNSFSDFLSSIALRGRSIIGIAAKTKQEISSAEVIKLCHQLISSKGTASGIALSNEILARYQLMEEDEKTKFFVALNEEFSAKHDDVAVAAQAYLENPQTDNMLRLQDASEAIRRQLIIRLNLAPNATQLLIEMRADLLDRLRDHRELVEVDRDFTKLFSSWFNGGFLQLSKMDWDSPASLLEKVIKYEAVHGMSGWSDLKDRIAPDRLIYGFFHPRLNSEPLIFIEVALTKEAPSKITSILSSEREEFDPAHADTAVFYSISNCQKGLRGVPLGSFLIKQVVEDLKESLPNLKEFVTLSPIPGFAKWLNKLEAAGGLTENIQLSSENLQLVTQICEGEWQNDADLADDLKPFISSAVAWYLSNEKNKKSQPVDPVAKFHLGNGARLERINWPADPSQQGLTNAYGAMVNYRYRIDEIEQNHERFVENGEINISPETMRLIRSFGKIAESIPVKREELAS